MEPSVERPAAAPSRLPDKVLVAPNGRSWDGFNGWSQRIILGMRGA